MSRVWKKTFENIQQLIDCLIGTQQVRQTFIARGTLVSFRFVLRPNDTFIDSYSREPRLRRCPLRACVSVYAHRCSSTRPGRLTLKLSCELPWKRLCKGTCKLLCTLPCMLPCKLAIGLRNLQSISEAQKRSRIRDRFHPCWTGRIFAF